MIPHDGATLARRGDRPRKRPAAPSVSTMCRSARNMERAGDAAGDAGRESPLTELAGGLERPLLIIHGMVDDNVVVAHTLRLSSALLAAGRSHRVLPLTGVTHMTPQETVAENLLRLQVEFLRASLGEPPGAG